MKKAVFVVVLTMGVISFCAAQSANDAQRLVGTWVSDNGMTFVFNANGTGTASGFNMGLTFDGNLFWGVSTSGVISIKFPDGNLEKLSFFHLMEEE